MGLIPAHAGKTSVMTTHGGWRRAHPRSRGENLRWAEERWGNRGSSPLTRGKRVLHARYAPVPGLIPAHAGKTLSATSSQCVDWAHPRSRGENMSLNTCGVPGGGSSPLTRGKRGLVCWPGCAGGLIPAHAGKTSVGRVLQPAPRAHPRSRGENLAPMMIRFGTAGSSPLTRGKPWSEVTRAQGCGLIPAHAGKTLTRSTRLTSLEAHPRSRGENGVGGSKCAVDAGSSPLTRGKRRGRQQVCG